MILAEKIALLRRQNGWSQEELADQLNVSRQAVSKWEGGTSIPDLDKILKLSALFEVSTDYLLKDELEQPDATAPLPKEERVTEPCRTVSFDEANAYLSTVQAVHGKMAAGVGLCILSPIALLVLGAWSDGTPSEERMAGLGVIFLLLFVALGLLLILPAAIRLEAFEYLEKDRPCLWCGGHRGAAETGVCAHLPPQHDPGRGALCAGRGADPGYGHAGSTRLLGRCCSRPAAGHCGRCSTVVHPGRDDPGQL